MSSTQVIAPPTSPLARCSARIVISARRQVTGGSTMSTSTSWSMPSSSTRASAASKAAMPSSVSVVRSALVEVKGISLSALCDPPASSPSAVPA